MRKDGIIDRHIRTLRRVNRNSIKIMPFGKERVISLVLTLEDPSKLKV